MIDRFSILAQLLFENSTIFWLLNRVMICIQDINRIFIHELWQVKGFHECFLVFRKIFTNSQFFPYRKMCRLFWFSFIFFTKYCRTKRSKTFKKKEFKFCFYFSKKVRDRVSTKDNFWFLQQNFDALKYL
jgi:hypothetical protein